MDNSHLQQSCESAEDGGLPVPYPVLLVAFSNFFDRNKLKPANHDQTRYLAEYFYRAGLSNRYTSGTAVKMLADLQKMKSIAQGRRPSYKGEDLEITSDTFRTKTFAINDAFSKTVLCLLASKGPRNLQTNGLIKLNNSWLRKSSSRNIHHIFPKAWVKKHGKRDWDANVVANIMLTDDHLNKNLIRSKAPSDYLSQFAKANTSVRGALASNGISEICVRWMKDDNFPKFISSRASFLAEMVDELLLKR